MNPNGYGSLRRVGLQCFLAAALVACGGGGDSGPSGTAPTISNLQYSPQAAYASASSATFTGQLAFSDPDGDLASATLTIVSSGGATVSTTAIPVEGAAGATSGVIQGSVVASLTVADNYTLQVFVTDARGLRSNTLSGPVRIAQFPWTSKLASSTARENAAAVAINDRIYVVGGARTDAGFYRGPVTGVVEAYDPKTNTWAAMPSMPTARALLVAAVVNGKLYAIGGAAEGGTTVGTVEEFDPGTEVWTARAPMPTPRYSAAGAQVGGRILVAGGSGSGFLSTSVSEIYDPATNSWSTAGSLPSERTELAGAESGGRMYAIGGNEGLTAALLPWYFPYRNVDAYDPTTNAWTSRSAMPTARWELTVVAVDGKLLAIGGADRRGGFDVLESFDVAANAWSTKTPSPRVLIGKPAAVVDGKVYVFGDGLTLEYDPANEIR